MKRTIVVIHAGALGDVLLAVPAIRSFGARFPQHEVVLIAATAVSQLLLECGLIDDWISLEGRACLGLFSKTLSVSSELESRLTRCDLAVAWMEDRDGALRSLFRERGVGPVHIQSPFAQGLNSRHQSDRFREALGEEVGGIRPEGTVEVPRHLSEWGKDYLDARRISRDHPLVLVHPGSGSIHKCLDPRRMALLIEQLSLKGMCPIVLEGPADQNVVGSALEFVRKPPLVLKNLDLSLLAGVLGQVAFYIGHDSGVTHLAALLGVRTIAIFGPTDHHRWAPRGSHVTILRGASCICGGWEAVKKCVDKPCLTVPVEEILAAVGGKGISTNPRNST